MGKAYEFSLTQQHWLLFGRSGGARLQSVRAHAANSVHGSWIGGGMCVRFTVDQVHDEGVSGDGRLMYLDGIFRFVFLNGKTTVCRIGMMSSS